ncbi:DUF2500 family protein [Haloimpatiens sp. FM7315]|uniref:DUF2500 family protein n=1 Tax=Haloimpatiens sp. FM7315 TaxID=3298609 RepID=UPI0035A272AD
MELPIKMGFFTGMPILFEVFFLVMVIVIVVTIIRSLVNYKRNAFSPILTEKAKVVSKRNEVTRNLYANNNFTNTRTRNYITFETEAGQRMELTISGKKFERDLYTEGF